MKRIFLGNDEIETALNQIKIDLGFKTDAALIEQLIRERAVKLAILPNGEKPNADVKQFNG